MSELILKRPEPTVEFGTSRIGWPTFSSGKPITTEEVKAMLDRLEEKEDRETYGQS